MVATAVEILARCYIGAMKHGGGDAILAAWSWASTGPDYQPKTGLNAGRGAQTTIGMALSKVEVD